MNKKLRWNSYFQVELLPSEGVFLISSEETVILKDPVIRAIAPFLEEESTADAVIEQLQQQIPAPYLHYTLQSLEQLGYVEEAVTLPPEIADICRALNLNDAVAQRRWEQATVSVKALGSLAIDSLVNALEACQITISDAGDREIVLTPDYLHPDLAQIDAENRNQDRPWLLVKPVIHELWLGPIFIPGQTGCWYCLAHRLARNSPVQTYLQRHGHTASSFVTTSNTQNIPLITAAVLKWILLEHHPQLEGQLLTWNALKFNTESHVLVKRPQCPQCGVPTPKEPQPVVLGRRKKVFTSDGGYRSVLPEATLARFRHQISPILGAIRQLHPVPDPSGGLTHVYLAQHHYAGLFDNLNALEQNLLGRSAGKGKEAIQSQASALGEALERYSGTYQGDEPHLHTTYSALGDQAIHPNACMSFSPNQYEQRLLWNQRHPHPFHWIPEPFDETEEIDWSPVWSLTAGHHKYLPTAYCYSGYHHQQSIQTAVTCWSDSNGCAAGNNLEEAILQGLLELIERDSIALWWYNRLSKPGIDLKAFAEDPYFERLHDYYDAIQREVWVLDLTSDLAIPTCAAISRRRNFDTEDIIFGFGTHLHPKLAILRALTELNQMLVGVGAGTEEGSLACQSTLPQVYFNWLQTATLDNQPYLLPDHQQTEPIWFNSSPTDQDDLREDIQYCQARVEQCGMELLVLEQTRLDVGLRVVKVIVPGMRHFWCRLGPGRLYDIPVKMGWLSVPLQEEQLNPIPFWM